MPVAGEPLFVPSNFIHSDGTLLREVMEKKGSDPLNNVNEDNYTVYSVKMKYEKQKLTVLVKYAKLSCTPKCPRSTR